jgi:penicillin-binding protein 1B
LGFTLPAAGKTGTSRDGWFAGFTSRIICIVWVGFDDNRELNLEGAKSALPIWTEFMKRAHKHREYRNVSEFEPPDGIVMVQVDPATGMLAAPGCPGVQVQAFIAGTQPVEICRLHGAGLAGTTQVTSWDTPAEETKKAASASGKPAAPAEPSRAIRAPARTPAAPEVQAQQPAPKKGLFRRILDMLK